MAISLLWSLYKKWTTPAKTNEVIFLHDKLTTRCGNHTHDKICLNKNCYFYNVGRIVWYLDNANKSLDLCMYLLSMSLFADAIIRAQKRGVKVRVITDHLHAYSPGSKVIDFLKAGIAVRSRPADHLIMHHKFCVIDYGENSSMLMNGSLNWTKGSVCGGNWENIVITSHPIVVEEYNREFMNLWRAFGMYKKSMVVAK